MSKFNLEAAKRGKADKLPKDYITIDKELLAQTIFINTDASLAEARHIINTTLKISDDKIYRAAKNDKEQR